VAMLQCEICGGKLIGKPGGLFECEYCGMEYSTEWAKAKVQEIRGTVQVEGTVQVTGTVQVSGPVKVEGSVTVQSLCDRGFFELENGHGDAAKEAFNRALDMDINWGDAYMGLIMCQFCIIVQTREDFRRRLLRHEFDRHQLFSKFLGNPGSPLHQEIVADYGALLDREKAQIAENIRLGEEKKEYFHSLRKKYAPVRGRITPNGGFILDKFGTLYSGSGLRGKDFQAQTPWENMLRIGSVSNRFGYSDMLIGMYADGTVIAEDRDNRVEVFDPEDQVTEVVGAESDHGRGFVGLRKDGSLITATSGEVTNFLRESLQSAKKSWEGIFVESLCGLTDYFYLEAVASLDEEEGEIAWIETSPHWLKNSNYYVNRHMTAMLHANGTVSLMNSSHHTLDTQVALWSDLIQVVPGIDSVAGLKADGTLVYAFPYETLTSGSELKRKEELKEQVQSWDDIVFLRMVYNDVIGVRRDGTLVTTSTKYAATPGVRNEVQLFEDIDTLAEDLEGTRARAYSALEQGPSKWSVPLPVAEPNAERRENLEQQLQSIHDELATLKGIFTVKRRKELEEKMGRILLELDRLK